MHDFSFSRYFNATCPAAAASAVDYAAAAVVVSIFDSFRVRLSCKIRFVDSPLPNTVPLLLGHGCFVNTSTGAVLLPICEWRISKFVEMCNLIYACSAKYVCISFGE